MKLSKAQQEVVDKMREGWVLRGSYLINGRHSEYLHSGTRRALFRLKILDKMPIYQLTEKYLKNGIRD